MKLLLKLSGGVFWWINLIKEHKIYKVLEKQT